jgi:hypothetical protein
MKAYANLMEEAKLRFACIDAAMSGTTRLPSAIAREFCFLQLRMLCEVTALGCLIAHGDIKQINKLRKEWSAATIMEKLEELHPSFYPPARSPKHHGISAQVRGHQIRLPNETRVDKPEREMRKRTASRRSAKAVAPRKIKGSNLRGYSVLAT